MFDVVFDEVPYDSRKGAWDTSGLKCRLRSFMWSAGPYSVDDCIVGEIWLIKRGRHFISSFNLMIFCDISEDGDMITREKCGRIRFYFKFLTLFRSVLNLSPPPRGAV